jgi:CheY-like chemotaxis protein
MPDQDGYSVCSQIKQHPEFGGIPVVLMSGVVNKSVADKAVAVQANELIRKPFQPQELIGRVKILLGPEETVAPESRERARSHALQNLFAPPPVAIPTPPPAPPVPTVPQVLPASLEPAWPRALAEAFTPLLPPFSSNPQRVSVDLQPVQRPSHANQQPASSLPSSPSSSEIAKLRGEVARVELLVKKLQTELQLEREYNQALEQQIRNLIAAD